MKKKNLQYPEIDCQYDYSTVIVKEKKVLLTAQCVCGGDILLCVLDNVETLPR